MADNYTIGAQLPEWIPDDPFAFKPSGNAPTIPAPGPATISPQDVWSTWFHGAPSSFPKIDPAKLNWNDNFLGTGFYITADPDEASGWINSWINPHKTQPTEHGAQVRPIQTPRSFRFWDLNDPADPTEVGKILAHPDAPTLTQEQKKLITDNWSLYQRWLTNKANQYKDAGWWSSHETPEIKAKQQAGETIDFQQIPFYSSTARALHGLRAALREQGYGGISDLTNRISDVIQTQAMIFPEDVDKVRNALSGQMGGFVNPEGTGPNLGSFLPGGGPDLKQGPSIQVRPEGIGPTMPTLLPGGGPMPDINQIAAYLSPEGGRPNQPPGIQDIGYTPSPTYDPQEVINRAVIKKQFPTMERDPRFTWSTFYNPTGPQKDYTLYTGNDMYDQLAKLMGPAYANVVQLLKDSKAQNALSVIDPQHSPDVGFNEFEKMLGFTPNESLSPPVARIAQHQTYHPVPGVGGSGWGTTGFQSHTTQSLEPEAVLHEAIHGLAKMGNIAHGQPQHSYDYLFGKGQEAANILARAGNFPKIVQQVSGYRLPEASYDRTHAYEVPTTIAQAALALNNPESATGGFSDYLTTPLGQKFESLPHGLIPRRFDLTDEEKNMIQEAYQGFLEQIKSLVPYSEGVIPQGVPQ
jgi:hypothetical protein